MNAGDDFFEEDENPDDLWDRFEIGPDGVTGPPDQGVKIGPLTDLSFSGIYQDRAGVTTADIAAVAIS